MMDCVFCKIVSGQFECSKVFDDEHLLAFMDINPVNIGHTLIIPKRHFELAKDIDDETTGGMFLLAKKINAAMRRSEIRLEGINYFLADGQAAGQEVFHAHLHVIPRFKDDGFGLKFPEHYGKSPASRIELNEIAKKIKKEL